MREARISGLLPGFPLPEPWQLVARAHIEAPDLRIAAGDVRVAEAEEIVAPGEVAT
jgi:hypothetical protein